MKRYFLPGLIFCSLIFFACGKEKFISSGDALISLSSDTLFFDTVFTTRGSVTKSFKVINENDQKLKLSQVRLTGGNNSPFKLNIDGKASTEASDITLNANDSLYVFVQVNVDPTDAQMSFILRDSVEINFNGNTRWVQLEAYGQNAIFLKNKVVTGSELWTDSLPYVISGFLQVDTGGMLSITAGARIYMHADAPVLIDGSLSAIGSVDRRITFAGDRLDEDYKDLPAAWPGIFFRSTSEGNVLKNVVVKNAYQGIIAQDLPTGLLPKVSISQSVFQNIYDVGILALNSSIHAENSLILNCGSNIALLLGGDYAFTNCTVASFGSYYVNHKNPVLQLSDYYEQAGTLFTAPLAAEFTNCIFWGDFGTVNNEILVAKKGSLPFDVRFYNSIYKAKDPVINATFTDCLLNATPLFDSVNTAKNIYDLHFEKHPESPALNAGKLTPFLFDLDGKARDAQPDIGCYERN